MRHQLIIVLLTLLFGCMDESELHAKNSESKKYVKDIIIPFLSSLEPQVYLDNVCPHIAKQYTESELNDSVISFRKGVGLLNTEKQILISGGNTVYWELDSGKSVISSSYFLKGEFSIGSKELAIGLIIEESRWCIGGLSERTSRTNQTKGLSL